MFYCTFIDSKEEKSLHFSRKMRPTDNKIFVPNNATCILWHIKKKLLKLLTREMLSTPLP